MNQQKTVICQSCGMKMKQISDFGTNKDGKKNDEYCTFCYQGGQFTDANISMEQKIEKLAKMSMNRHGLSEKEARQQASTLIPQLKRWNKSGQTKNKKALLIIALLGGLIFVIGIIAYKKSGSSGGSSTPASLVPIWVAIFVPILAANKKKKQKQARHELAGPTQKKIALTLILSIALLLGIMTMLIFF